MSQQGKREFRKKTFREFVANMKHPINGQLDALFEETSYRIELAGVALVIGLGFYRDFSESRWIVVLLASALVLMVELLNSAIENAMRLLYSETSEGARKVYDQAAAAVSVVNFVAIGIAAYFIYRPR